MSNIIGKHLQIHTVIRNQLGVLEKLFYSYTKWVDFIGPRMNNKTHIFTHHFLIRVSLGSQNEELDKINGLTYKYFQHVQRNLIISFFK